MPSSADTPEFRAYQRARDAVVQMLQRGASPSAPVDPSTYWSEELENIDYMIEASPLIVRRLRAHAFHITGIRPYDYRDKADTKRESFVARLRALERLGGDQLRVPESPALGGFGYDIDGRLFNVDTIKFYEVLIGMERGGVLPAMRATDRPTVCEIGGGWGGFAYQFKTLVPGCRYVIVDFPELFLYSATYLGTLFPDARCAFCGTAETPTIGDAGNADFVFVPHTMAAQAFELPVDLTVNMVSFQEMTDAQVRTYARQAADGGCAWLYSFNRERSPYNTEIVSVMEALSDRYRLTEVPVLDTDYTSAIRKPPKPGSMVERSEFSYRHVVGRLDGRAVMASRRLTGAADTSGATNVPDGPRVVLGMTLYNNAAHLREALDSLLAQTFGDFGLVLLDDASSDDTEAIAREYAARDTRIRSFRHPTRRAMIATWREVVDLASREFPTADLFAWVSDHDRWHPRWLGRLLDEILDDPTTVLVYPITRRIGQDGAELEKGPRLFDTADCADSVQRWRRFCHSGVGAGDMVYGLMRLDALRKAGVFRSVLRPDRLLVAELTLYGRFRQVPEVLWYRRDAPGTSVERQLHSLMLPEEQPDGFGAPPWWQHARVLWTQYATNPSSGVALSRLDWARMLLRYQLTYGWRHFRKTEASHAIGRTIDNTIWVKKIARHYYHHAVYHTLVGARVAWGRAKRLWRRGVYEALMLTHRLGLRGSRRIDRASPPEPR